MKNTAVVIIILMICSLYVASSFAELYDRAPDVLPGTVPEMRTPEYWIDRMENPDEIILPVDEIMRRNVRYREWAKSDNPFEGVRKERIPIPYFYPGFVLSPPDFHNLAPEAAADTVISRIEAQIDYLRSREWGNPFGVRYAGWEIEQVIDQMTMENVGDAVDVRDGITVRTTRLRNVPAQHPRWVGAGDAGSHRWDRWSYGVVGIARPVTVLHTSRNGEFLFVLAGNAYGWIRSEDVAFGSRAEIERFVSPSGFIMCTGDREQFYTDKSVTYSSGWFMMSDRLPMASRLNPRLIQVPVRKTSGELAVESAWLAPDADVSVGYLPYTRRTIVLQAFKLLDTPYDFTGALLGRQHETIYRDIFACFGFDLPPTDPLFTFYGDDDTVLEPDAGKKEQYRVILGHEPFVTLQSCGRHGQLLLGEYNGEPIVFDQHGYGYEDESGRRLEIMRCSVGTLMLPEYFLKRNVTFLELK